MKIIRLFDKTIEKEGAESILILEAGTNHYELSDQSGISPYDAAVTLIKAAKDCGGAAIKFQAYNADKTASSKYASNQYKYMRRRDSLEVDDYIKLIKEAKKIGIPIFFSFFDLEMLKALGDEVPVFKVASPDITNCLLLEAINSYKKPVILSTAGSYDWEINDAIGFLKDCEVVIMHCRAIYPTPDKQLDLGAIKTLNKKFPNNIIGWSSHNNWVDNGLTALALGANVLEYHFKRYEYNDHKIKGGDYPVSIDEEQVIDLKRKLHTFSDAYGNPDVRFPPEEEPLRQNGRRGLYAKYNINAGSRLNPNDFIALRPAIVKELNIVEANNAQVLSINGMMTIKETILQGEPLTMDNIIIKND